MKLGRKKKTKIIKLVKKLVLALMILLPFLLIIIIIWPVDLTYSISAKTEVIEFKTLDDNISKIPLPYVEVFNYDLASLGRHSGTFKVAKGATTRIERIAHAKSALIQIQGHIDHNNGTLFSAGTFYTKEEDEILKEAGNFIEFYIDSIDARVARGETIIIPITGDVTIGRSVNYESYGNSSAILKSGEVIVIGKPLFGNTHFKSESYDLSIGDQFIIRDNDKNDKSNADKAYGFVSINEDCGMTAAYKVIAKEGRIITPGPADAKHNPGYHISTSLISRFLYDPVVKGLSLAILILGAISRMFPMINSIFFNNRK